MDCNETFQTFHTLLHLTYIRPLLTSRAFWTVNISLRQVCVFFFRFECVLCDENCKSWTSLSSHYVTHHQSEPVVICLCGFEIKSKTVLYKHVTEHKEESKKLRNENNKVDDLNVKDYIS